jgi:hypothetical protein
MSAPGQYITRLRVSRSVGHDVIAVATGVSCERQKQIEAGAATPSYRERRAYARFFGFCSAEAFDDGWRGSVVLLSRGDLYGGIPVINLAPAGRPLEYTEPYENSGIGHAYIDPPPDVVGPNLFAFIIEGDSMAPNYPDGHYAICRPEAPEGIGEGHAVFVRFGPAQDYTCTFKLCFGAGPAHVELRPLNASHPSITVLKEDIIRMVPVIAVVSPDRAHPRWSMKSRLVGDIDHHS